VKASQIPIATGGKIHNGEWWFRLRCRSSIRRS
jgi:hypothetical protein